MSFRLLFPRFSLLTACRLALVMAQALAQACERFSLLVSTWGSLLDYAAIFISVSFNSFYYSITFFI